MPAERFFDLIYLLVKLNTGVKINARTNPMMTEIKTGFKIRNANAAKRTNRTTAAVLLNVLSVISI